MISLLRNKRNCVAALVGAAILTGCAQSPSKQFYQACIDSGASEPVCRMRAAELRQNEPNRLSRLGAVMRSTGAGLNRSQSRPRPRIAESMMPTTTNCFQVNAGVASSTSCQTSP